MEKYKLGWIINGCLVGTAIITSVIFPNPVVILSIVAGTALMGTIQSIFTIVESKEEKDHRERRTLVKHIPTCNDYKNNPEPQKVYENLHNNKNQATFKGNHTQLLDNRKNTITEQNNETTLEI